jgi:hypothetical protein
MSHQPTPEFITPEQAVMAEVGSLFLDEEFMGREPRLDFVPLNPDNGEVELDIDALQPIQSNVRGPHLFALSRLHIPLPPIPVIVYPDLERPLIGEGHHRAYLRHYLGFTTVHAQLVRTDEEFRAASLVPDQWTLIANGDSMATFRQNYEKRYKTNTADRGITHISHLRVTQDTNAHSEMGLSWPA